MLRRFLSHARCGPLVMRTMFPPHTHAKITRAIAEGERFHGGEVRVIIEPSLGLAQIWNDVAPRTRALQLFSEAGVWDTEHNSGVLLYILVADRDIEIVVDRGVRAVVADEEWGLICNDIEGQFKEGHFEAGVLNAIERIHQVLARHFPPRSASKENELPNEPTIR